MHTDENKKNFTSFLKQWAPITSLVVLTIGLMFFFKENRENFDRIIEKGANNLVDFYTQNLKPLFTKTDLTNEDVFNFAMDQKLPIDKENKRVIQISDGPKGREITELKDDSYISGTNNVEQFAEYFDLDQAQRAEVDSILQNYQEDIYSSILYSDNNSLAISPKIIDLQQAILTDLMLFARETSNRKVKTAIPASYKIEKPIVDKAIRDLRTIENKDFIFFTPDTIFSRQIDFDQAKLKDELRKSKLEFVKLNKSLEALGINISIKEKQNSNPNKSIPEVFSFEIDTNSIKVLCPDAFKANVKIPDFEEFKLEMENLKENLKVFSFQITKDVLSNLDNFIIEDSNGVISSPEIKIDMGDIGSVIRESLKILNDENLMNGVRINIDSLIEAHPELQEEFELNLENGFEEEMEKLEEGVE